MIIPLLFKNNLNKENFIKTASELSILKENIAGSKCTGCELNKKGKPLIDAFIEDFQKLPKEKEQFVLSLLDKKIKTPFKDSFFDFKEKTFTPFEYKTVKVEEFKKTIGLPPPHLNIPNINKTSSEVKSSIKKRKIIFQNFQGPGDIVMLTAAIRDLFMKYKNENKENPFLIDVKTNSMHIWEGNPYVEWAKGTPLNEKDEDVEVYKLQYPLIHQSNQGPYHFSEAFTEEIEEKLGIRITRRIGKGDIHIRPEEEFWGYNERSSWFKEYGVDPDSEYWIIDAGHKQDFTAKFWGKTKFQKLVDHYLGKIQFVQIGHNAHIHPPLKNVINLVGKTDDRQLIRLVWASSGVVTPVSFPMVLSAAVPLRKGTCKGKLERPCVVVAGGREPSVWQAHTNHQFIHTCGSLPCCDRGGCWVSRTRPIGDGDEKDYRNMCHHVTIDDFGDEVPFCMHMISVEDVIRRIDMYNQFYEDKRNKYTYNNKAK